MRLAIVRTHPTQYFSHLYRAIASTPGIDLKVFYILKDRGQGEFDPDFNQFVSWDTDLLAGYEYEFLAPAPLPFPPKHVFESRSTQLVQHLSAEKFDVLFSAGYALWLDWQVISYALKNKIPLICRPELNELGTVRPALKQWARASFLRWYFAQISAFLYIGKQSRKYYLEYDGEESKAFFSPYAVQNELFSLPPDSTKTRKHWKVELGFGNCDYVLLYVGKLTPVKGVDILIDSLKHLKQKHKVGVLIVGDGPLRAQFESQIKEIGIEHFHFAGFQNQSNLAKYYQTGDVLVVPSRIEPWGLVVNEAMASGLPIITSHTVGSAYDLIETDKTGWIFEGLNPLKLTQKIELFYNKLTKSGISQSYIQSKIKQYSTQEAAKGFKDALDYIKTR
jgi:glycosyltransferase involved in cell wall biosynthesis